METLSTIWSAINGVFAIGYFALLVMALRRNTRAFWQIAIGVYVLDYASNWGVDKIFFWGKEAMTGAIAVFAFIAGIILWLFWND
jgi:hypothetical protein